MSVCEREGVGVSVSRDMVTPSVKVCDPLGDLVVESETLRDKESVGDPVSETEPVASNVIDLLAESVREKESVWSLLNVVVRLEDFAYVIVFVVVNDLVSVSVTDSVSEIVKLRDGPVLESVIWLV